MQLEKNKRLLSCYFFFFLNSLNCLLHVYALPFYVQCIGKSIQVQLPTSLSTHMQARFSSRADQEGQYVQTMRQWRSLTPSILVLGRLAVPSLCAISHHSLACIDIKNQNGGWLQSHLATGNRAGI